MSGATVTISGGQLLQRRESTGSGRQRSRSYLGPPVDIDVDDGLIVGITSTRRRHTSAIDATGMVLLPGLINGHTHSHETFFRGRYPKMRLERWMHYVRPPLPLDLSPDDVYVRTVVQAVAAARGGATYVVDDVGLPGLPEELLDAVLRGYRDVGIRAVVAPTMADRTFAEAVPYLADELPAAAAAQLAAAAGDPQQALDVLTRRLTRQAAEGDSLVRLGVAASAPQRCTDPFIQQLAALAEHANVPLLSHLNETRAQAVTAQLLYGETMTSHLHRLGILSPRLTAIHGIWLTDADAALLAASGTTVQHNPISNLRLGSGLASIQRLRRAGVHVALGTDGLGSSVSASMLDTVRQAALLSTARHEPWLTAEDALDMATLNGARALGHTDLGRLQPGDRADLVGVRLDHPSLIPLNDPLRQIVYGDAGVDLMVVDGRVVLSSGMPQHLDWPQNAAAAQKVHARISSQLASAEAWVDDMMGAALQRAIKRIDLLDIPPDTYQSLLPADTSTT